MKRAIILVLDSFGVGAAPDADKFGDQGANTLGHIADHCAAGRGDTDHRQGPLQLPNLCKMGLARLAQGATGQVPQGLTLDGPLIAAHGYAKELSSGKDTPSGHWEMAGVPVLFDWGYFSDKQNSFPEQLLQTIVEKANLPGYLGNCHASGTQILDDLGQAHMETGKPIFYTSADSVFQIACHEETFGVEALLDLCQLVREELAPYNIGRVIARPFTGKCAGDFQRTGNRRDYSVPPPSQTVLQKLVEEKQGEVISIGKIADIFAHCGITQKIKKTGLQDLFDGTLQAMEQAGNNSIIFTNFVDFDSAYGHRRDPTGYASALEAFDQRLPEMIAKMHPEDVLILTADHGCDPTWPGSDHTREYVPIMVYGQQIVAQDLGERQTFADIGQSLAHYFALSSMDYGQSFL